MLLIALIPVSSVWAENPCLAKADYEVRLDSPGNGLENFKTIDQDGVGVCYAVSATTVMKSVLPGNPDLSFLDYAVQFKRNAHNDNANGALKETSKKNHHLKEGDDKKSVLDGGWGVCTHFDKMMQKGFCPKNKITAESPNQNPSEQMQSLLLLNEIFDLKTNSKPEDFDAIMKSVDQFIENERKSFLRICEEFPQEMKKMLEDIYEHKKRKIDEVQHSERKKIKKKGILSEDVNSLDQDLQKTNAEIQSLNDKIEKIENDRKEELSQFDQKLGKKLVGKVLPGVQENQKEKIERKYRKLLSGPTLKKSELIEQKESLESELSIQNGSLKKINDIENDIEKIKKDMDQIGKQVPDEKAGILGATKFEFAPDLEEKLNVEYRNNIQGGANAIQVAKDFVKKHVLKNQTDQDTLSLVDKTYRNLDSDNEKKDPQSCRRTNNAFNFEKEKSLFLEKNKDHCKNNLVKNSAIKVLEEIGNLILLDLDPRTYIKDLSNKKLNFDFFDKVIGSSCLDSDRIKPDPMMKCKEHDFSAQADQFDSKGSSKASKSENFVENRKKEFFKNASSSLDSGRAIDLAICADALYPNQKNSNFGLSCNKNKHAVTLIGYGCKNGKTRYLIQNSWGENSSHNPKHEPDSKRKGAFWSEDEEIIKDVARYSVINEGA